MIELMHLSSHSLFISAYAHLILVLLLQALKIKSSEAQLVCLLCMCIHMSINAPSRIGELDKVIYRLAPERIADPFIPALIEHNSSKYFKK